MAGRTDPEKAALIAELAVARHCLAEAGGDLRASTEQLKESLNLPARAKQSFAKHRGVWLGGAGLLGFILSRIPARKKVVYMEKTSGQKIGLAAKVGLLWPAVKFVGGLAAPLLSKIVGARLGEMASRFIPRDESGEAADRSGQPW